MDVSGGNVGTGGQAAAAAVAVAVVAAVAAAVAAPSHPPCTTPPHPYRPAGADRRVSGGGRDCHAAHGGGPEQDRPAARTGQVQGHPQGTGEGGRVWGHPPVCMLSGVVDNGTPAGVHALWCRRQWEHAASGVGAAAASHAVAVRTAPPTLGWCSLAWSARPGRPDAAAEASGQHLQPDHLCRRDHGAGVHQGASSRATARGRRSSSSTSTSRHTGS